MSLIKAIGGFSVRFILQLFLFPGQSVSTGFEFITSLRYKRCLSELSGRMCTLVEFLYANIYFFLQNHKRTRTSYRSCTGLFVLKELLIVFRML